LHAKLDKQPSISNRMSGFIRARVYYRRFQIAHPEGLWFNIDDCTGRVIWFGHDCPWWGVWSRQDCLLPPPRGWAIWKTADLSSAHSYGICLLFFRQLLQSKNSRQLPFLVTSILSQQPQQLFLRLLINPLYCCHLFLKAGTLLRLLT